ncbi:MAG: transposase, partial [bacterium]|nr:transposase [bacterium]
FRKKLYYSLEDLQVDVDFWVHKYNTDRPHSGKYCYGKTPFQTFLDAKYIAFEKNTHLLINNHKEVHNESSLSDTGSSALVSVC